MINIKRTEIPLSLQRVEIQNYKAAIVSWKENPIGDAPKQPSYYRNDDVLNALEECFFSKCYLTEKRFESIYSMDIEHFYPKGIDEFPEKAYDWDNLFPADHGANMSKPKKFPIDGYLNPCDDNDDVEKSILYRLDFDGQKVYFEAVDNTNKKAENTAELLYKIHNGYNKPSIEKAKELQTALFKKRDEIHKQIMLWQTAKLNNNTTEEFTHRKKLKNLLSRKSSFTMLMRSISAVKIHLSEEFFD